MNEEQMRAIFLLAGINLTSVKQIENQYWPDHPNYEEVRKESPWWEVITDLGKVTIGWRKRVISIEWELALEREVTNDNVTKSATNVHAYSYGDAVSYLRVWRLETQRQIHRNSQAAQEKKDGQA